MRLSAICTFLFLLSTNCLHAYDEVAFKHHSLEFSITPAIDYHFVTWPLRTAGYKTEVNNALKPFTGFNFGLAYVYRPIRMMGISAGFNNLDYGVKINSPAGARHPIDYGYRGYLGVPILVHIYQQVFRTVLEFATGPEFLLPLFSVAHSPVAAVGDYTQTYGGIDIQGNTTLAWTLQLTATIPVKGKFELAIGPEMKFLNICAVPLSPYYNQSAHEINCYFGVKIGFRIGSNFFKKRDKGDQLYRASL